MNSRQGSVKHLIIQHIQVLQQSVFSMRYEARLKIRLQIEHYQMAALGWC